MLKTRRLRLCMIGLVLSVLAGMRAASEDSTPQKSDEPLRLYCVVICGVTEPTSTGIHGEVSLVNNGKRTITQEFTHTSFDYLKFELLDQDGKSLAVSHERIAFVSQEPPEKPHTQNIEPAKWVRREFCALCFIEEVEKLLINDTYYQLVAVMGVKCLNKDGTTTIHKLRSNPSTFRFGVRKPTPPAIYVPPKD